MSKIYIFTGKGGVGKSSVAAAHAVKSALEGKRTILVSTDMAHNLGDIFEVNPEKEPLTVMENLDIYEIDPEYVMEHDFKDIASCVSNMLSDVQSNDWSDMGIAPGMVSKYCPCSFAYSLSTCVSSTCWVPGSVPRLADA